MLPNGDQGQSNRAVAGPLQRLVGRRWLAACAGRTDNACVATPIGRRALGIARGS